MDGEGDDGCQFDIEIDETCQSRASKKLKKDDNHLEVDDEGGPSHQEIDIEDKNPFQIHVILDVVFKMLPFEDVKKFRLISSTWNQVGTLELSKRPQKSIKFYSTHDDDQVDVMVQLQVRHNEVFPYDQNPQLFTNFSLDMSFLMSPVIDTFVHHFVPKCIEFLYHFDTDDFYVDDLGDFLVQISGTVEEIKYNFTVYPTKKSLKLDEKLRKKVIAQLTSTVFPNLRKISQKFNSELATDFLIYPLVGQNCPKLHHLQIGSIETLGDTAEYLKKQFEQSGLMSKLTILELIDFQDGFEKLSLFTEFGLNGTLQLTKLTIKQDIFSCVEAMTNFYFPLIASQAGSLKILEISSPGHNSTFKFEKPASRIPFPSLLNLLILQIDYFSTSNKTSTQLYFEPINFSVQTPSLVEFRTRDIGTFLAQKLGQGQGGSVKSVVILKDTSDKVKVLDLRNKPSLNFDEIFEIFPNLEFLELDSSCHFYPTKLPFRVQLKKVVIHCDLQDLLYISGQLQDVKKVDLLVDCENKLVDVESYKDFFGRVLFKNLDLGWAKENSESYYKRNNFYQQYLTKISQHYATLDSVTFTLVGYKISEEFKRDFRAILPHCSFICSPFKSPKNN